MTPSVNKNDLDVAQVFQTYVALNGDVAKTALVLELPRDTVQNLASIERWGDKIQEWNKLREGDAKEAQVQINRAINYVQAHRSRNLLDKVISHLSQGSAEDLIDRLTITTRNGPEFKTRALTDLVKAMEACQLMTQRALGDVAAERPAEPTSQQSNLALLVLNAMNAAEKDTNLDSVAVVRKQLSEGK